MALRMAPRLFLAIAATSALLWGCTQNPKPRPPRTARRPTTRTIDWPSTFPTTGPAVRTDFRVSDMRVESLEPRTYFYVHETATFQTLPRKVGEALAELGSAEAEGRVRFDGPRVMRYLGATQELNKPFELEVGFPVAAGTEPFGKFKVRRETEPFRCATVTFRGPVTLIDKAYDKLIPAMQAAGVQATDEAREVYSRWDGPGAPTNEVLVGIGVNGGSSE
jgi:effector-binding domain-containing protein